MNSVVLTRSADSATFKLWDLRAPLQPRFSLSALRVREVKIAAGGALLLVMEPEAGRGPDGRQAAWYPMRVLDLQDGSLVQVRRLSCVCVPQLARNAGWRHLCEQCIGSAV